MKKKTPDKNVISGINVNINVGCDAVRFDRSRLIEMIRETAVQFGAKKAQINFAVVGDKEIIDINKKFLKKKKPTDCLSFDLSDDEENLKVFDIVVNAEEAGRQAKSRKRRPQSELALYFLHGLLHNLGFDDSAPAKAAKMHKMEDKILEKFGYGIVYKSEPRQ